MKEIRKKWKTLPIVLAVIILLQGCTIYKKQNVSLQEAAQQQVNAKVKTVNGNVYFKYIAFENDQYFGIKQVKGDMKKTRLDSEYIEKIQLKNKPGSVIVSILFPIGLTIGVVLIWASIGFSNLAK